MKNLTEKLIEYFNSVSNELADAIEHLEMNKENESSKTLSSSHKDVITFNLDERRTQDNLLKGKYLGTLIEIYKYVDGNFIGIRQTNIKQFNKLVDDIYSKTDWIHHETLSDIVFKWIISKHLKQNTKDLVSHIEEYKKSHIKRYTSFFLIKNLSIEKPFVLGKTIINFFTEEYLLKVFSSLKKSISEVEKKEIVKKLKGQVTIICDVQDGEINKSIEVAHDECALTIDSLKLFSNTLSNPQEFATFDLDSRSAESTFNQSILIIETTSKGDFVNINYNSKYLNEKIEYIIDEEKLSLMTNSGLHYIDSFLRDHKDSELSKLIIQSIKYFGLTLSQGDLHRRVVDIFTIMESLVLKNDSANILNSLTTYIPKIVTKHPEDRKEITSLLKRMYKIRSEMIHHAKKTTINIQDLKKLQLCLRTMIINYIIISNTHSNKDSILSEIDDAINKAY